MYTVETKPGTYTVLKRILHINTGIQTFRDIISDYDECLRSGALDGTLVHAVVPVNQQHLGKGRGDCYQNVLAIYDFNMIFTFFVVGWEGIAHDARILSEALTNPNAPFPLRSPKDKYHLCDAAYTHTRRFMAPYRNVRYWLGDFHRRRALNNKEKFNHSHAKVRNVIERAFGVLKARFPVLKRMTRFPLITQRNITIACFAFHNNNNVQDQDVQIHTHKRYSFCCTSKLKYPDENSNPKPVFSDPAFYTSKESLSASNLCYGKELEEVKSWNMMITYYIRRGDLDSAYYVFENMSIRTTVTWNSMLAGYSKTPENARQLFDKIPEPDIVSYNTMLNCYMHNCGIKAAQTFFERMLFKDTASWNTMLSGYIHYGMMDQASELFQTMPEKNNVSWNLMISGYAAVGDLVYAEKLFKDAPSKCVVARTAMVTGYMKSRKVDLAEKVFDEMPEKNLVTWNTMVSGYIENKRAEDGLKLFKMMVEIRVKPNPSTISSVLVGCSNLSSLKLGNQVHQFVIKFPLSLHTMVNTSLISMYCKCGDLKCAWKLFLVISHKDIVTWNAMISGYAQHGEGEKALWLFNNMKHEGIRPDWITFIGVLSACNHAGLVNFGIQYFDSMQRDYKIKPKPDHFTCMVDLLGRAGMLREALNLVKTMPCKPHIAIFGSLLGACRVHKNLELAEYAARNLLDCDPASAAGYVQLANVYAAMRKWDHVATVRRLMKDNKVIKFPGYSWIEIKRCVHEFRSGDRIHPESGLIHDKLNELEMKMKAAGYVPVLESALHDVGDQQKEKLLLWHSEKLAIAYGLIKMAEGVPIRVFKNLRVCGDCHEATKFISAIEKREIIVRDNSRFHHFKDGKCSCRDYW